MLATLDTRKRILSTFTTTKGVAIVRAWIADIEGDIEDDIEDAEHREDMLFKVMHDLHSLC